MPLCAALEHILELRREHRIIDTHHGLQHGNAVLKTVAAAPERQHTLGHTIKIPFHTGLLQAQQQGNRRRVHEQLNILLAHFTDRKRSEYERHLSHIPQAER